MRKHVLKIQDTSVEFGGTKTMKINQIEWDTGFMLSPINGEMVDYVNSTPRYKKLPLLENKYEFVFNQHQGHFCFKSHTEATQQQQRPKNYSNFFL